MFSPTDWSDPESRDFALDHYEADFAEALYVSEQPPTIEDYVAVMALGVPEIGEPEMPLDVQGELAARCLLASMAVDSDVTEYEHWRNIKTEEDRQAARDRRTRTRAAATRWRESNFADGQALAEMIDGFNEIDAERIGGGGNV